MAYQEVVIDETQPSNVEYFKFTSIGEKLAGYFLRTEPTTGTYAKEGQLNYIFRAKKRDGEVGDISLTPPTMAARGLEQAAKEGLLKPGAMVVLEFHKELAPTKAGYSPTKLFKLKIDPNPGKPPPPVAAPASAPDPEDIPF